MDVPPPPVVVSFTHTPPPLSLHDAFTQRVQAALRVVLTADAPPAPRARRRPSPADALFSDHALCDALDERTAWSDEAPLLLRLAEQRRDEQGAPVARMAPEEIRTQLRSLFMLDCGITQIDDEASLLLLRDIERVRLTGNWVRVVPPLCERLTELHLSCNALVAFPWVAIAGAPCLVQLLLAHNAIETLHPAPAALGSPVGASLRVLTLNHNSLTYVITPRAQPHAHSLPDPSDLSLISLSVISVISLADLSR